MVCHSLGFSDILLFGMVDSKDISKKCKISLRKAIMERGN